MIFATDHHAGTSIMSHLYSRASEEIPAMRQAARDEMAGVMRLFPVGEAESAPGYRYEAPLAPEDFL
jgi:hypothetical protein